MSIFARRHPARGPRARDPRAVVFDAELRRRFEGFAARLEALRRRREGAGQASIAGGGQEWIDLRPYREGDDLRDLDWALLARSDRPFVRVHQREAAERWAILLDTSASMGVGDEGKLQSAAEVAAAWLAVGLASGTEVELSWHANDEIHARTFTRRTELATALATLETCRASGASGLAQLLGRRELAQCGRHVVLGDLFDVEPRRLFTWRERTQEIVVGQWLARCEWGRGLERAHRWRDPENGHELDVRTEGETLARYESELAHWLERWRASCALHRVRHGCFDAGAPFEDAAAHLFGLAS